MASKQFKLPVHNRHGADAQAQEEKVVVVPVPHVENVPKGERPEGEPTTEKFEYEEVNKPKPEAPKLTFPHPGKAMRGNLWLFNKLREPVVIDFDGFGEEFEANEFRQFPEAVARFLAYKSTFLFQPNGKEVRSLVLEYKKGFGEAYAEGVTADLIEMIDRAADPNPMGRGTGGVPTKAKVIYL